MSHNDPRAQPAPRVRLELRRCGCPEIEHYHGCRNRYDRGCHCQICRQGVTAMRRKQRGQPPRADPGEDQYRRDEIAWFLTWNMTDERIADRVGVPIYTVQRVRVLARGGES